MDDLQGMAEVISEKTSRIVDRETVFNVMVKFIYYIHQHKLVDLNTCLIDVRIMSSIPVYRPVDNPDFNPHDCPVEMVMFTFSGPGTEPEHVEGYITVMNEKPRQSRLMRGDEILVEFTLDPPPAQWLDRVNGFFAGGRPLPHPLNMESKGILN